MKAHYQKLFAYNTWANDRFAEVIGQMKVPDTEILRLFSHIANAQVIWLERLQNQQNTVGVWDEYNVEKAIGMVKESSLALEAFVDSAEAFDNTVVYKNSRGHQFETAAGDILTHVANHGTHHRGQIATLLRKKEITPPASDFIFFVR
ncbi:DinB family protein [Roseivirga pacifica]|uniref:DinB family protein n=1 Tax=Roseivirga pacifica TaxID=1267423 RepID=UPI003BA94862